MHRSGIRKFIFHGLQPKLVKHESLKNMPYTILLLAYIIIDYSRLVVPRIVSL